MFLKVLLRTAEINKLIVQMIVFNLGKTLFKLAKVVIDCDVFYYSKLVE